MAEDFAGSDAAFGAALSADGWRERDEEQGEGEERKTTERESRPLTAIRRRRGWVPFDRAQGQRDDIKAKTRQSGSRRFGRRSLGPTHNEELPPGSALTRETQGTGLRRGLRRWRTRSLLRPSTRARTRFECQAGPDGADKCLFPR